MGTKVYTIGGGNPLGSGQYAWQQDQLALLQTLLPTVLPSSQTLSGSAYVDAPAAPDSWNEEFASGSSDLAIRGFTVANFTDSVIMTRLGDVICSPTVTLANNQYRSSRFGSILLLQLPAAKNCQIMKAVTGATAALRSFLFAARVGVPMIGGFAGGVFISTNSAPPFITAAHNSGAGPGWCWSYIDATPSQRYLGRQINAAQFVDLNTTTNVNFTYTADTFFINHDEVTPENHGGHLHAQSGQIRNQTVGGANGSLIMATPIAAAGVSLVSGASNQGGGGIFAIDYIRRMPVNAWFGQ